MKAPTPGKKEVKRMRRIILRLTLLSLLVFVLIGSFSVVSASSETVVLYEGRDTAQEATAPKATPFTGYCDSTGLALTP